MDFGSYQSSLSMKEMVMKVHAVSLLDRITTMESMVLPDYFIVLNVLHIFKIFYELKLTYDRCSKL